MKGTPVRQRIPELVVPGKRLGEARSPRPASRCATCCRRRDSQSVEWERHIPILDQGNLGSCTGNALVGALGTGPLWEALMRLLPKVPTLDEAMAVRIYSEAEKIDGGVGYPPEDEGSYGLSVAKAAKTDGFVSGFLHATSVDAAHTAIQAGPFLFGTKWFSGMDDPTSEGIVKPTGYVRGGHEIVSRQYDAAPRPVVARQLVGRRLGARRPVRARHPVPRLPPRPAGRHHVAGSAHRTRADTRPRTRPEGHLHRGRVRSARRLVPLSSSLA
jgi:hypothetical protein